MTPDHIYTTEREGGNSARKVNKVENKADFIRDQLFRQTTPTSTTSSIVGVSRFEITLY